MSPRYPEVSGISPDLQSMASNPIFMCAEALSPSSGSWVLDLRSASIHMQTGGANDVNIVAVYSYK
jgi:hypothetical protein